MDRPGSGRVGGRALEKLQVKKVDAQLGEWCDQSVAGGLAHRSLGGPVLEEARAALVVGEAAERLPLGGGEELAGEAIGTHGAVAALHVDADPRIEGDADDRDATGVRDVEIR